MADTAAALQAIEAVFLAESAAHDYIACQPPGSKLTVQAHRLHQDAPAPLYGLLARSARVIQELEEAPVTTRRSEPRRKRGSLWSLSALMFDSQDKERLEG